VYEFYTVSNYRDLLFNVKASFCLLLIISTCELTKVVVLNYSGKDEETSTTVANKCEKLKRNEKRRKNERRFEVTLGYSITVRDVSMSGVRRPSSVRACVRACVNNFFKQHLL